MSVGPGHHKPILGPQQHRYAACAMMLSLTALSHFLSGCSSTRQILLPATELTGLDTSTSAQSQRWPVVRLRNGETQTMMGPIEKFFIEQKRESILIRPPFTARIDGPDLHVFARGRRRIIPMAETSDVLVFYDDHKTTRKRVGVTFVSAAAATFVLGLTILGQQSARPGPLDNQRKMLFSGFLGAYLVLAIPGVYLLVTDPSPP